MSFPPAQHKTPFDPTTIKPISVGFEMSAQVDALFDAIAKAKAAVPAIKKTRTAEVTMKNGGKYSYSYADLADIIESVTKPFSAEGLAVIQPIQIHEGEHVILTMITHKSGQWLRSAYRLDIDPDMGEQEKGSAITYSRRYSFCATTGLVAEDDDDGALAQAKKNPEGGAAARDDGKSKKLVTEGQLKRLYAISKQYKWIEEEVMEVVGLAFKLDSTKKLNMAQYDRLVGWIEKMSYAQTLEEFKKLNAAAAAKAGPAPKADSKPDPEAWPEGRE